MSDTTDALAAMPPVTGTLLERMGIEVLELSADRTVGAMPVAGNTQPYGLLHGGASAVLAETLASYAAQVHAGAGRAKRDTRYSSFPLFDRTIRTRVSGPKRNWSAAQ